MQGKGILFLLGVITGILLFGLAMIMLMPKLMLTVHQSKFSTVEETCSKLQEAIAASGWNSLAVRNMNESMAKSQVNMTRQVRLVELCKAAYAKDILVTNPEVSTLMPCAWGVYEGNDGKIYISGINMGLMGKIFGGNIAKVMGSAVAKEEKDMLKSVIK